MKRTNKKTKSSEKPAAMRPPKSKPAPERLWIEIVREHVAGFQYHDGQLATLTAGDDLTLMREPSNLHDDNAIYLLHNRTQLKIGYVKRGTAKRLHEVRLSVARTDAELPKFRARIVSYHPSNPSWQACVYLVEMQYPAGCGLADSEL